MCGGEGEQASGGDFKTDDRGFEVTGFQQACADFVVCPGGVTVQKGYNPFTGVYERRNLQLALRPYLLTLAQSAAIRGEPNPAPLFCCLT